MLAPTAYLQKVHAYRTVAEAIANAGVMNPTGGFTFQDMKGVETTYSFPELEKMTAQRGAALQALGLAKGDRMGMIIAEPEHFVLTFLGALRVGILPVPLYPPLSLGGLDAYAEKTAKILTTCGAKLLVASESLQNVLWSLVGTVPSLQKLVKAEDLVASTATPVFPTIEPNDLAFLQYTSGSTSDPKGVMVTHAGLLQNVHDIMDGLECSAEGGDKAVSWLPLYHDMGLIGFVVAPIIHAVPIVYIPTVRFIKRPNCWFETMNTHRATLTFAPNFAYALLAKKAKAEDLAKWDLSCIRVLGCGAEPIHPDTIRDFNTTFAASGLKETAILPAYGMAEATLAIAFKPCGHTMRTHVVDADVFQGEGRISTPTANEATILEHVSCGRPFPSYDLRIRGEQGEWLAEGLEGEICIKGPSVTPGYYDNDAATAETMVDGFLKTGDLGYLLDGEVYVTGRLKDLIILNGRNIHPQSVEWVCASVEGVRKGNVVAFSRPGSQSEELVVALETKAEDRAALMAAVRAAVQAGLAMTVADIVCLEPGTLPKTSSGKLQRRKTRQQYLAGALGTEGSRLPGATADKITLARHVAKSMWTRAKTAVLWR